MEYICNICNKHYSSYQSLWIHNKKYHVCATTQLHKMSTKSPHDSTLNKYCCKFCKKILSRSDSLHP